MVANSLQDFDAKEMTSTLRIDQSCSDGIEKCSVFIIFACSHDAVFKMCRFRVFKLCWQKICRLCVNVRPVPQICHRSQNVPASFERSLISIAKRFYQRKLDFRLLLLL